MIEVSAAIGAWIVQALLEAGGDARLLQQATDFEVSVAANPDARIPLSTETALWDEAARLTGDEHFGLHAAERLRPGVFDVLDYAVRTAPTLRVALERLTRYNRLVHDSAVFSLTEDAGSARIEHSLGGARQSHHAAEFTLASILVVGGELCGQKLHARRVEFTHAAPHSPTEHQRIFGVVPRCSASVNALELNQGVLDSMVPAADPMLWRVIERHADALLAAQQGGADTTAERTRRLLRATLGEDENACSLSTIAGRLHMSERSLQRRLAEEGRTFDSVLDELRHQLALRYLADRRISIGEVAYLLGYSERSAFHRAFKRWTGTTPALARKSAA